MSSESLGPGVRKAGVLEPGERESWRLESGSPPGAQRAVSPGAKCLPPKVETSFRSYSGPSENPEEPACVEDGTLQFREKNPPIVLLANLSVSES